MVIQMIRMMIIANDDVVSLIILHNEANEASCCSLILPSSSRFHATFLLVALCFCNINICSIAAISTLSLYFVPTATVAPFMLLQNYVNIRCFVLLQQQHKHLFCCYASLQQQHNHEVVALCCYKIYINICFVAFLQQVHQQLCSQ